MSQNLEYLDQIQTYRNMYPELDVLFLYDAKGMVVIGANSAGHGSVGAKITKVQVNFVFDNNDTLIVGEDEIMEHFALADTEASINFLEGIRAREIKELIIVELEAL